MLENQHLAFYPLGSPSITSGLAVHENHAGQSVLDLAFSNDRIDIPFFVKLIRSDIFPIKYVEVRSKLSDVKKQAGAHSNQYLFRSKLTIFEQYAAENSHTFSRKMMVEI